MTNIYPYAFDSKLFSGLSGLAFYLIPMLKTDYVAERIYTAIVHEEMEVFIPWISYWLLVFMLFLPTNVNIMLK